MRGVTRSFQVGDRQLDVLKSIDLTIHCGTMVAIMGTSGSGKSTLLNLLGCLDQPSSGSYKVWGREAKSLSSDVLASLRRKYFGFVFQRYHLLPGLSAQGNVEIPAMYACLPDAERSLRAQTLLYRLGLWDRIAHKPHQLSGGQQQRVSIARALMNGGQVIFADEPTGALDTESGLDMMRLLVELHGLGHTVIIVTHDPDVAAYAERVIELSDGEIVADRANTRQRERVDADAGEPSLPGLKTLPVHPRRTRASKIGLLAEAFRMAHLALLAHRLRTTLTLLGIIIGIVSLVSIMALGEGGQRHMRETLGTLTRNTVEVYRGSGWGDSRALSIHTLVPDDIEVLQEQSYIDSATPMTKDGFMVRYDSLDSNATVSGVGESFFRTRSIAVAEGRAFSRDDVQRQAQVVVIDQATRAKFFAGTSPLGKVIIIGTVPCTVIGVTSARSQDFYLDRGLNLLVPYTTAGTRLFGRQDFDSISVKVRDGLPSTLAEKNINDLMLRKHGEKDFFTNNMDALAQVYASTTKSIALMLSVIAAISLMVGGIGVMNIMLVSVTERTREIGIRIAVGARQSDIMKQFLVEAIVVCLIGAAVGIALSFLIGGVFSFVVKDWRMVFTPGAVVSALLSSTLIGTAFGYLPARKASRLNPVDALVRD
jgi:macrolide transport system ATP-binding/permease protein